MFNRIAAWFSVEPTLSLLMVITAVVLFGSAIAKKELSTDNFWPWLRRIIEASIGAILFIGLLWAFRAILNNNIDTFQATHGSRTEINRESAYSIWGRPHIQHELTVNHYIDVEVKEEIPREDPTAAPIYRTTIERREIPQNSIIGFRGDVSMALTEREKGYALYSGFLIENQYTYHIINDSGDKTEAEFTFPLSPNQTLFKDFKISLDGEDISSKLRFASDQVTWTEVMPAHKQFQIDITYTSRGMDYYYYQIPNQREIKDFILTLSVDRLPVRLLNYPEGVLTPTQIQPTDGGKGSILTWQLDRTITTSGMGIALLQPEQPGENVLRILLNSPYALTLLGTMLALTLIILDEPVRFLDLALLSAVYSVQFLIMAGVSDYFFGFWGSLFLGATLAGLMTFLLFRKLPSKQLRIIIYFLVGFFTLVYPLSGLLEQRIHRDSFNYLVQVGMIIYIFGLSLLRQKTSISEKSGD